ncbi:MAG: pyridoxamine 5'-phosphate oxidase family protein [Candidatus Omnitrophica bacterium]|nr:pyridoxamine 5'-phosphate oxidase family protein [Candidatus Omnitrophota bacterium]
MIEIPEDVSSFLKRQNFLMVLTVNNEKVINAAAKSVVQIEPTGKIYLVDLYEGKTRSNLEENPNTTLCAIDEEEFQGWQLKGKAKAVDFKEGCKHLEYFDQHINKRIVERIIGNIKKNKLGEYSETHFPDPKYLIEFETEKIVNLAGK